MGFLPCVDGTPRFYSAPLTNQQVCTWHPCMRIVGFDCAEDEHAAVLLDMSGEFERRVDVINERGQIQESLAELMLAVGPNAQLVVVVESKRSRDRKFLSLSKDVGFSDELDEFDRFLANTPSTPDNDL